MQLFITIPLEWFVLKTPWQGAQTTIHCAVSDEVEGLSGQYFADCKPKKPCPEALDDEIAERLWSVSSELVGLDEK